MSRELRDLRKTLKLLYQVDRSAFVVAVVTSVLESVVYPVVLLVVWQGFGLVVGAESGERLISRAMVLLGILFGLLAVEAVLRTVNEAATTILQTESSQQINGRIMKKMSEVPYHLFEDNDFQARYGLLISQASHRPGQLVQSFIGSLSALTAAFAIAATLFAFAPVLDVFLLLLFPLTIAEARYHGRIVDLQTHASPALFRMTYLAQRSIDATWQRDIRVHHSAVLDDEYRFLSSRYLTELRTLLRRFQMIRLGVGLGAAAIMTLAVGVVFWVVGRTPSGLSQAAILLPALVIGLGQGRSFAATWGVMTECLSYLEQLFDFFDKPFNQSEAVHGIVSGGAPAPKVA
jgi:ABC-type multidrug transport system fused ATPase/permease subunit